MIILLMSTKNNNLYMWKYYIVDALKYSDSYKKFQLNFDVDFK